VKTVFFDVDTQIDFLYPAGALYVAGAEAIVAQIAALNHFAASRGIPVISTVDAHPENDPEFHDWPPHCIAGTAGQRKPASTLLDRRVVIPNIPGPPEIDNAQQVVLEKQAFDCFTNVNLATLLTLLAAERYIVYGVVTEICVKSAAFGLLKTGRAVELVTDAVKGIDSTAQARMFEEFTAKGGVLTSVAQVMGEVYH
jgi:nicotinamidase/pyrazinamidase